MIGRNFINSPTMPDQNKSGKNTLSVVAVDAMIGHAMRLAANAYASLGAAPSCSFRSASSVVTMAPSTNIPTTRISENRTTMFMVKPIVQSAITPARNAPGIARPTRIADRVPSAKTITIITRITAAITFASRSVSRSLTLLDWSCR